MEFDLENPLTTYEDDRHRPDSMAALFAAESDHMTSDIGAIDVSLRRDAVSLILQAQFDCNLDPFLSYLAVNYVDRFLSKREMPLEKPWILHLLAISCLSLASKMNKSNFSIADFQRGGGHIADSQSIQRMELLVLNALDWRMRSITPFSFLRFFISFFSPAHPPLLQALKSHASQILFKAQNEVQIMEFRPSVIAAAALLSAAYELFPIQFAAFRASVAACHYVNKEKLLECCSVIGDDAIDSRVLSPDAMAAPATVSGSDTPVTVLGHNLSGSESDRTVGSSSNDRDFKKRRTSLSPGDYNDDSVK